MTAELYGLILFVLPGFAGSAVFYFLRPNRKLSDFERLVVSLAFSCLAYASMLLILKEWDSIPGNCAAVNTLNDGFASYIKSHKLIAVPLAILTACVEGYILAAASKSPEFGQVLRNLGIAYVPQPDVWNQVMEEYRAHHLMIQTSTKTYIGKVKYYSVDPDLEPEMHLDGGSLDVQPLGNLNFKVLNVLPHGVYLRSSEIQAIAPLGVPTQRQPPNGPPPPAAA